MKKTLLLSALCLTFFLANAQIKLGVEAGGVLSGMLWADEAEYSMTVYKTDPKFGFLIGVSADFPVSEMFFVNASLGFRNVGTTISNRKLGHQDSLEAMVVNLNNMFLNATFNYAINAGDVKIFAGAGGYSGYAISGKQELKPKNGTNSSVDLKIGSDETDNILPIDLGLSFVGGAYLTPSVKLSLGYQHGLLNLSTSKADYGPVIKNRMGFVSVTYYFLGNK